MAEPAPKAAPAVAATTESGAKPVSEMTDAERKELRASKFKVENPEEAKRLARAQRFGVTCAELEAQKRLERKSRFGIVSEAEKKAAERKELEERCVKQHVLHKSAGTCSELHS